jgi:hypothetical protein
MASLISKRSAHANMMQRCSSTPSTFSRSTAKTLPLSMRARRPEGIFVALFEQGEIGPDLSWRPMYALDQGQESGVAGDESRGGNRLVAVTECSTIASETVALTFDTSETDVTALRAV